MDDAQVEAIQKIFEKYGATSGSDMMVLSGALGEATPTLMHTVQSAIPDRASLKAFVVEGVVAIYRLMDRGASGESGKLSAGADPMMAGMFPGNSMEDAFVRPLAEQAAESSLAIFGG